MTDFFSGATSATQQTDQCAVTGQYRLCAPVTITVPDNDIYKVEVSSSMTALGSTAGFGLYCAASAGPTCLSTPSAAGFSLTPNQFTNVSRSGISVVGPGTHTFGMAARFDVGIGALNSANTTTTVRWRSYYGQF